jgi:hypothetical protein
MLCTTNHGLSSLGGGLHPFRVSGCSASCSSMMDNVRTMNLSTATYYYVVAIAAATPWSETCVLLCLCTSKVMYMLRPVTEFVQFWNWTNGLPIPNQKFWIGMGSWSIQNLNVSQLGMCFWKSCVLVHNSGLGHPNLELLSAVYVTMT